jgi:hypothetical protein
MFGLGNFIFDLRGSIEHLILVCYHKRDEQFQFYSEADLLSLSLSLDRVELFPGLQNGGTQ